MSEAAAIGEVAQHIVYDAVGRGCDLEYTGKEVHVKAVTAFLSAAHDAALVMRKMGHDRDWIEAQRTFAQSQLHQIALRTCESPIEQIMLAVLSYLPVTRFESYPPVICSSRYDERKPHPDILIVPQFQADPYRFDFVIIARRKDGSTRKIAIECDGKKFHHTTMEQAIRDHQRDADALQMGIDTMRYKGSMIWKEPFHCAEEIAAELDFWHGPAGRANG